MRRMKESMSRTESMQPASLTSKPRQKVLTRSRSLALPLADLDMSLPSDGPGAGHPTLKGKADEDCHRQMPGEPRKDTKKPLRRQKSLAELFGAVIYKSRVQLQELFSRRDKDSTRNGNKDALPQRLRCQLDASASDGTGTAVGMVMGSSPDNGILAGASVTASHKTTRPRERVLRQKQHLMPNQQANVIGWSNTNLSCNNSNTGTPRSRTPEELFCVTPETNGKERSVSTRSLDTLHQAKTRNSMQATPPCKSQLLKPDKDFCGKAALVKSNSDSLCRVVLLLPDHGATALTKASSDDSCFVRRNRSSLASGQPGVSQDTSLMVTSGTSASINSVADWLLVGSVEAAYNEPLLCSLGVEAVVDITNIPPHRVPAEKKTSCPCTCSKKHFRSKLNLAVDDIEWENIEQHFDDVNAFINGWRQRGKRVLVFSYHGKSRGPAVVVQHLMTHYRIPLDRAMAHVRSRRPQTRINPGFVRALQRLEERLAGQDDACPPPPQFPPCAPSSPKTAWDEC